MKKKYQWPVEYETPKVYSIDTAFQQALGITYSCGAGTTPPASGCSKGTSATGGDGSCSFGRLASGGTAGSSCISGVQPQ